MPGRAATRWRASLAMNGIAADHHHHRRRQAQRRRNHPRQGRRARLRPHRQGRLYAKPPAADDFRRHHAAHPRPCEAAGADGALSGFILRRGATRSGGGGPCQRVRPEVAGPMTGSAWWRGRAARRHIAAEPLSIDTSSRPSPLPPRCARSPFPAPRGRMCPPHFKSLRMILPTLLLGKLSTNSITLGIL